MSFTGKATYTAGTTLPELAEDVSDLIGIISPYDTPLLDALGDPLREATSTHHEWLEDVLLPNKDAINDATWTDPSSDTTFDVDDGSRFRVGDQIQVEGSEEVMLVTAVNTNTLTVVRGYAGTTPENLADNQLVNILGNAALEGAEKPNLRFTNRVRCGNYTQIFTAAVEVSGSDMAAGQLGLADEMDFQKQERLRELLRNLERTVICGELPTRDRRMRGIVDFLPSREMHGQPHLSHELIEQVLSAGSADLIVVGGFQKRRINAFCSDSRSYGATDTTFTDMVSVYESDFGICRVVTTRWLPQDAALFLDSSRISVLPLAGRSFHFKPLAGAGNYECGELIGEYTLEFKNPTCHALVRGLATAKEVVT